MPRPLLSCDLFSNAPLCNYIDNYAEAVEHEHVQFNMESRCCKCDVTFTGNQEGPQP